MYEENKNAAWRNHDFRSVNQNRIVAGVDRAIKSGVTLLTLLSFYAYTKKT
jgi:hypothetical protein